MNTVNYREHVALIMKSSRQVVLVDIIIPVHNASSTLAATVRSALHQRIPPHLLPKLEEYSLEINVCCYDDGSIDRSWSILQDLCQQFALSKREENVIPSNLLIAQGEGGIGRGAGFARNRAVELQSQDSDHHYLCLLDSDDTMHPYRVAEQTVCILDLPLDERGRTLLGCRFDRDPPDSTWHYSHWANNLTDEQVLLERFREVTILQPTWFLCRNLFESLGGYVEAPPLGSSAEDVATFIKKERTENNRLVHMHETVETLRLAEDLRFFHDHLNRGGTVKLHRTAESLVTYRHTGNSQCFRTSRKLLLQLRVLAMERTILRTKWQSDEGRFIIWGAGRDGKDFFKALSDDLRRQVYCFVDVDKKKLELGSYANRDICTKVPIIHFSYLISDESLRAQIQSDWERGDESIEIEGRITKSKLLDVSRIHGATRPAKRQRQAHRASLNCLNLDPATLQRLPVVICVAKNRTNGVLERNVSLIARTEGTNLWHFS